MEFLADWSWVLYGALLVLCGELIQRIKLRRWRKRQWKVDRETSNIYASALSLVQNDSLVNNLFPQFVYSGSPDEWRDCEDVKWQEDLEEIQAMRTGVIKVEKEKEKIRVLKLKRKE